MQAGAFLGYSSFGVLADRFGRRPVFVAFVAGAALAVPAFALAGRTPLALLALAPAVGYLGHGYFSVFGALLAELFPGEVRGTAQGLCYNVGRAVSALAPFAIGALALHFLFAGRRSGRSRRQDRRVRAGLRALRNTCR